MMDIGITEQQLFAYVGRLAMENQLLRQQLALLQQQIAQGQANGKEPEVQEHEAPEHERSASFD